MINPANWEYRDPQQAFEYALSIGALVLPGDGPNRVDMYMYLGTIRLGSVVIDEFKHIETREVIQVTK